MSKIKHFAEAISCRQGTGGEITEDAMNEAYKICAIKDPDKRKAAIDKVYKWREPTMGKKVTRTPEQQAKNDAIYKEYKDAWGAKDGS